MKTVILGAGLSGISTAYFLQDTEEEIILLEKEKTLGGLCRSITKDGYIYDIGPHILFSKDKEMLSLMLEVLDRKNDLVRSNKILYKGREVLYPFENDLSKLPADDLKYCITAFNSNPYENYDATNMIQFFLKTFGEGITNCYLRPYNEKIWKYDPAFMNTSMVDRIPKPTKEEIRRSAAGETIQGYLHQLYFSYPSEGGIEAVPQGFYNRLDKNKCKLKTETKIKSIDKIEKGFVIKTENEEICCDRLISTIPIQELVGLYARSSAEAKAAAEDLHYNSILIAFIRTPYDLSGANFAFMIPDKEVMFHRISKMDFLGNEYHKGSEATYMVEVTFREGDYIDNMDESEIKEKISQGMEQIGFAKSGSDVSFIDISYHKYAYVIYDLHHSENMGVLREFFATEGIYLNGRFGNFEYWNMDKILRESKTLCERIEAR